MGKTFFEQCVVEDLERMERENAILREEVKEQMAYKDQYHNLMSEYRTAIFSLGIDFFRDDEGTLLDAVECGGRLRGLFGALQEQNAILREALERIADCSTDRGMWQLVEIAREALQRAGGDNG